MSVTKQEQARAEADAARERLLGAARTLQERLNPATLAEQAWERARDGGERAATTAAKAVRNRPAVAAAAALAVVALFARRPLTRLARRIGGAIGTKKAPPCKRRRGRGE